MIDLGPCRDIVKRIDGIMPVLFWKVKKELFTAGYYEMLDRLFPKVVIFMRKMPEECAGNIVHIREFQERFEKVTQWVVMVKAMGYLTLKGITKAHTI